MLERFSGVLVDHEIACYRRDPPKNKLSPSVASASAFEATSSGTDIKHLLLLPPKRQHHPQSKRPTHTQSPTPDASPKMESPLRRSRRPPTWPKKPLEANRTSRQLLPRHSLSSYLPLLRLVNPGQSRWKRNRTGRLVSRKSASMG